RRDAGANRGCAEARRTRPMTIVSLNQARSLLRAAVLVCLGAHAIAEAAQPRIADPMTLSSIGDASMGPLMDAWLGTLHEEQPDIVRGPRWRHVGDAAAIGALMFELADIAPMSRAPLPAELAPYAHQFAGDMMKAPVLVRVGWRGDKPVFLAFNKRPDSPLQPAVRRGDHWEHPGTLNGFHALMAGETDLAPMGRELWPDEAAAYASLHAGQVPFEIRVARGGFNTQQRTTAQAVFVNARNPLARITLPQLAAVFGRWPTITRWGQLGLTGEWS